MNPLVSAIVSTYNSARYLSECLNDLERQSISDRLEIIVVDSGSLQNEGMIVRKFQERYRNIRYLRTKIRETVYGAWNRGIRTARGKYLTNANTDDRHRVDAFEKMVVFLENHPDIALVYADLIKTKLENETFEKCTPCGRFSWPEWDRNLLMLKGCFIGPQPMWRRAVHDIYGFFDGSFISSGDYEFWLRISQTLEFHHLQETLGLYLESPGSIEHRSGEDKLKENKRILSVYRQAAREGKIIGLKPLEAIEHYLLNSSCFTSSKLLEAFDRIEKLAGYKSEESVSEVSSMPRSVESYFELKNKILNGDKSIETITGIVVACTRLILGRTGWYARLCRDAGNFAAQGSVESFKGSANEPPGYNNISVVEMMFSAIQPLRKGSRAGDSIQALRNILAQFPEFSRGHNDLASLFLKSGHTQEALRHCEAAAAADPENPDLQKRLADLYYMESACIEDALRLYRKVLSLRPGDLQTRMTMGNILLSLQRFEEAEGHYRQVLAIDPQHREAAEILRKLSGRLGLAAGGGGSPEELHAAAVRLALSGDEAGACQRLERLVELHPLFALAHNDLAVLSYRAGDPDRALRHYEKAARLEPGNMTFQKNLADCYWVGFGRITDALKVYVDILKTDPENIGILMALGKLCHFLGHKDDARGFWERVLEIEPWNAEARIQLDPGHADTRTA